MDENETAPEVLRIGEFTLDVPRAELIGPKGKVGLRPQSFDVLLLLVRNAGCLVTREELHETIWADRAVTDDSLTQCLIDIRKAIGDRDRKIIRTVPRRGFIFVGEVASQPSGERQTFQRRWIVAAVVATVSAVASLWIFDMVRIERAVMDDSVAVLPFIDLGEHGVDQFLGDGLAANVLTSLGQYPDLRVIARTSTFAEWAREADIAEIRRALNVEFVLEGSVRRDGLAVEIMTNLIETSGGTRVWSETYDVGEQELFMIQRAIAGAVAEIVSPGQVSTASSVDPESLSDVHLVWIASEYENMVREQQQVNEAQLDFAIRLYRDAIDSNPASAIAHSRLAGALMYRGDVENAEKHVLEALKLDPNISEVQESLGRYFWVQNLPAAAGSAWERAIELNPSNVDALSAYASWIWVSEDVERPLEYYRRALELDPLNLSRYADLGFLLGSKSDVEATEQLISEIERLFDTPEAYLLIAELLDFAGRIDESIAWTIRARDRQADNPLLIDALAELYVDIGDIETARALQPDPGPGVLLKMRRYDEFVEAAEKLIVDQPHDVHLRYLLAQAYNIQGRSWDALEIFDALGVLRDPTGTLRQIIDIEARISMAESLLGTGDSTKAREIAEWWQVNEHLGGRDWWVHFYLACAYSIGNKDDAALASLVQIPDSPRMPWMYLVEDAPCMKRFDDEPRYQDVLRQLEERQARVRERLPATLRRLQASRPIS